MCTTFERVVHAGSVRKSQTHAASFTRSLDPTGTKPLRVVVPISHCHRQLHASGTNRQQGESKRVSIDSTFTFRPHVGKGEREGGRN